MRLGIQNYAVGKMDERIGVNCLKKGTLDRKPMGLEDFRESSLLEEELFCCSP